MSVNVWKRQPTKKPQKNETKTASTAKLCLISEKGPAPLHTTQPHTIFVFLILGLSKKILVSAWPLLDENLKTVKSIGCTDVLFFVADLIF